MAPQISTTFWRFSMENGHFSHIFAQNSPTGCGPRMIFYPDVLGWAPDLTSHSKSLLVGWEDSYVLSNLANFKK